jgi:hypothetical protein
MTTVTSEFSDPVYQTWRSCSIHDHQPTAQNQTCFVLKFALTLLVNTRYSKLMVHNPGWCWFEDEDEFTTNHIHNTPLYSAAYAGTVSYRSVILPRSISFSVVNFLLFAAAQCYRRVVLSLKY